MIQSRTDHLKDSIRSEMASNFNSNQNADGDDK
jgi:hypothetical protein